MKLVLGLFLTCFVLTACSVDTAPKNGTQKCADSSSRPCVDGYYCAEDGFCWKNGTAPGESDAASGGAGGETPASPDAPVIEPDAQSGLANVPNGVECKSAGDCTSGFCVSGVCCSSVCEGTCMACNVAGKMGACSPVPIGDLPVRAADCTKSDVAMCGQDGRCDGTGACSKYPDGTICVAGVCNASAVTGIKKCQAGKCESGGSEVCTPFGCDSSKNECFGSCSMDNQCAPSQSCKNGSCGKKPLGAKCGKTDECESNFCADGVCCAQACDGACLSCNSVGSPGECLPIANGKTDPRKICKDDGASACKTSGVCDGKGGCALYASGTACTTPSCSGNSALPASTCNGSGSCVQSAAIPCGSIKCAAGVCPRDCATSNDCVNPNQCSAGSCGLKEAGQGCGGNGECRSGVCADSVCCDKACGGACQACNLPASAGKCSNVTAGGADPHGVCTAKKQDASTCKENGLCDGSGGCQNFASGTVCTPEMCSMDKASPASTCDGGGQCVAKTGQMCLPYKCNGTKCGQVCGDDSQCIAPNACVNGSCGPKPLGASCSSTAQCQSGFCAQGVCCNTACSGVQCSACNLAGSKGTCSLVSVDTIDPAGKCTNSSTTCGTKGTCNADGSCKVTASGTQCAAPVCSGNASVIPAATCNGSGSCSTPAAQVCGGGLYTCAAGACKTSCLADSDCTAGNYCGGGSCQAKKANGAAAASGSECSSTYRVDGVCCSTPSCPGEMCPSSGSTYTGAQQCNLNNVGTCSAVSSSCGLPLTCGSMNKCKTYAIYDVSTYDDGESVYGN